MTRLRDVLLPGVLDNEWGMSQRDLEVARATVRPRSECRHCNPPGHPCQTDDCTEPVTHPNDYGRLCNCLCERHNERGT